MTEKQFAEIQERYATLPSVGVPSQVRTDLAACISEIARVGAPFEPSEEEQEAEAKTRQADLNAAPMWKAAGVEPPKRTSGARKK